MSETRTVLVFDTQVESRDALVAALRQDGYGVLATGVGVDAAGLTEDCRVDLAVVEWVSPELDGLEVACRVKAQRPFVPVIWLTAERSADAIRGYIRNTDGFLSRPVNLEDFRLQVQALLEAKAEHERLVASGEPDAEDTDPVTGLLRTSLLAGRLADAVDSGREHETPVSLLLIDVDDFRIVNDMVGFEGGNSVLRQLGDRVRQVMRSVDVLFRLGGDELAVVLPFTDDIGAVIAAERLREEVQVHTFQVSGAGSTLPVRLTISIGVAASTLLGYDAGALLSLGHEALDAAKQSQNRVVLGGH